MSIKAGVIPFVACITLLTGDGRMAYAADAAVHHIHITTPSPTEAVAWYGQYLGCTAIADRGDAAKCGSVELLFVVQPSIGRSQDTGVDHISFSFADLPTKIAALEKIGVRGSGVRFQRFEDGATFRDI